MTTRAIDPILAYQFSIEVTEDPFGVLGFKIPIRGYFMEVSGLDVEYETAEYKFTNKLGMAGSNFVPMRPVHQPITLKRGITDSGSFWLWHSLLGYGGKPIFKGYVLITMYNRSYMPIASWSAKQAWVSKISGPQIRAESSDFVVEEMTLTHAGLERLSINPAFRVLEATMKALLP